MRARFFKLDPLKILALMDQLGGRIRQLTVDYDEVNAFIREKKAAGAEQKEGFLARLKKYREISAYAAKLNAVTVEDKVRMACGENGAAPVLPVKSFGKGQIIFREGDESPYMYQIHGGSVAIFSKYGTPAEVKLTTLYTNDFFGEMGLISKEARSATAVVEENETVLECIRAEDLEAQREGKMNPEQMMEWIQYIFRNMDDAVLLTGSNGKVLYANPAADRLFGLDVFGYDRIWDAIPYSEENDAFIQLFIDGCMEKKSLRSLVDYVNREGQRFHLHVTLSCETEDANLALIVIHDLTSLIKVHSAFERYTYPEIADYVLTSPDGEKQGGKQRDVSVLMSDLRGFTAMTGRLSSDRPIAMLNHYFGEMAAVIQRHQGTVIEFLGDGIFVVFGAPQELPDHAAEAVRCAVEMQNALLDVNTWNREHGYPELEMGIGVNSGLAVVGNIGSEHKMKYGCMGETVNLAGRLESLCLGGEVCVTESTRKKIREDLKTLLESSFMPKGGKEELKYYSVAGIGNVCRLDRAAGEICWRKLREGREFVFYLLDGKIVDPEPHAGVMTEVSEDEKFGMLTTDSILRPPQDLMIRIGGLEAYAKVTHCGERGCSVGFTMKPEGFGELLR